MVKIILRQFDEVAAEKDKFRRNIVLQLFHYNIKIKQAQIGLVYSIN